MSRVYLDHNASAPLRDEARAAMLSALGVAGNPSSVHAEGRAARAIVERARAQVAVAVGCNAGEVVFTSGATEAASVLSGFGRVEVERTAHDALWAHRRDGDGPGVVALGLANGETGIVGEVPARGGDALLLDVTQAVGRVPFAFSWTEADFAVLSAHKLGGPRGVGALIVRDGVDIAPLQRGGGQEMGRRSGTEDVAGIAGFGGAAEAAVGDLANGVWGRVAKLRDYLEEAIEAAESDTILVGKGVTRLPNTICMVTPGWKGESQVIAMDLAGFAISAGSACSSGKVRENRVLAAMGYDAQAAGSAIRVSLGPATTKDEVARFAAAWSERRKKLRDRAA